MPYTCSNSQIKVTDVSHQKKNFIHDCKLEKRMRNFEQIHTRKMSAEIQNLGIRSQAKRNGVHDILNV